MSGETGELTDDQSVNAALVWGENPELEYFRVIMNNQMDMNDSLTGDATLTELFEGQEVPRPSPSAAVRRPGRQQNEAEVVDSSGLSLNENDTVDNIGTVDGSLEAWFAKKKLEKDIDVAFEVGTLETAPDIPPRVDRVQGGQQTQQIQFYPSDPPPPHFHPSGQYHHPDNVDVNAPPQVPGFIFVSSSGNSCTVQTKSESKQSTHPLSKSAFSDDSDGYEEEVDNHRTSKLWGCGRIVLIIVLLAVIVAAVILAILFSQKSNSVEPSSEAVEAEAPSWVSLPGEPTPSPVDFFSPVFSPPSSPAPEQTTGPTPEQTGENAPPTLRPSKESGVDTSTPTMSNVRVRIEMLSPESMDALADPTSPQFGALEWLMNETQADSYSDRQLSQRFVLATLFFSTDGSGWIQSSSWLEEGIDECDWWGIECNDNGGVTVMRLSENNLSGPLPPEIHLLSDTLQEIIFNDNKISGTIPTSVGLLSNLERWQLTDNLMEGTLPTQLGNLQNIRLLSFRSNDISGTLPSEIGQLNVIRTFDISENVVVGTIPKEFGNLDSLETLYFNDNQLTGTIPSELVQLSELSRLIVMKNDLTGEMPDGLCSVTELEADCVDEIICLPGCCTSCCIDGGDCSSNTVSPSERPSPPPISTPIEPPVSPTEEPSVPTDALPTTDDSLGSPTQGETDEPTFFPTTEITTSSPTEADTLDSTFEDADCTTTIATDATCYETGDDIVISLRNCDAEDRDWIGIYPARTSSSELGGAIAWIYACGDKSCREAVSTGEATFFDVQGSGTFRVYLVRSDGVDNGDPFIPLGIGNEFTMSTDCNN